MRSLTLEQLREVAPELPTLDEALAFFVDEAPGCRAARRPQAAHAARRARRRDRAARARGPHGRQRRARRRPARRRAGRAGCGSGSRIRRTGSRSPASPTSGRSCRSDSTSMRASVPIRVPRLARRAGASAVMLQHRLVTASSVERAHAAGLPVLAWTVDEPRRPRPRRGGRCRRRDHERSEDLRGYTGGVNRGVTIAALSSCGAAGVIVAVLLATAPGAGADDGTTTARDDRRRRRRPRPRRRRRPPPTTTTPAPPQPKVIVAGVKIGGTLVGGLTVVEARELVKQRFARPLTLVAGPGARIVVTPKELGATPDIEQAVNLARPACSAPAIVVPLKVEVSRTEGRAARRLARQALPPRPGRRDAQAAQPDAVRDEGRFGPPAQGGHRRRARSSSR